MSCWADAADESAVMIVTAAIANRVLNISSPAGGGWASNIRICRVQIDKLQGNALSRTLRDAFLLAAPGHILEAAKIFEMAGSVAKPVNNPTMDDDHDGGRAEG